jgi:hypothetical protein
VALLGSSRARRRPEPARSVIATVAAPSATAPLVEPVQTPVASYDLAVGPEDVQVEVDGEKRQVSAGKLKLTGAPGSTFKIVLSRGGDRAEHRVAVTLSGLVPERLELRARPIAPQRSNERKKSSAKPAEEAAKPAAEGKRRQSRRRRGSKPALTSSSSAMKHRVRLGFALAFLCLLALARGSMAQARAPSTPPALPQPKAAPAPKASRRKSKPRRASCAAWS